MTAGSVLLVDAGNSRTKWAVCGKEDGFGTPFQKSGVFINTELPGIAPADWHGCRRAVMSSVADRSVAASLEALLQTLEMDVHRVQARAEACGLVNGYADPQQLGADRWAAAIAAWQHDGAPCVVANAGTELTVDAIGKAKDDGHGLFLGGLIVPGFRLMQQSLLQGTAGLSTVFGARSAFPDNTGDGVYSGAAAAMSGAVFHMLQELRQCEGVLPHCFLSGGDAPLLARALTATEGLAVEITVIDNLVLQGLQLIERECP